MAMTSNKPYLLRAFYDWIADNDCTPYVVVDAMFPGVEVPQIYVNDGQIVLNVAPRAVTAFNLDNDALCFNTRFGGVPTDIYVPIKAIVGIYARENGEGMVFDPSAPETVADQSDTQRQDPSDKAPSAPKPLGLTPSVRGPSARTPSARTPLGLTPSAAKPTGTKPSDPKPLGPGPSGPKPSGPRLRVVK